MGRLAGTMSQRQLRRSDAGWGGSRRQTSELTNRNQIQGRRGGITQHLMGKSNVQTDTTAVNLAAIERKISTLPREISQSLPTTGVGIWQQAPTDEEKSAEAIVAQTTGRRAESDNEGAAWTIR